MTAFIDRLPAVRGKLLANEQLAPFTWFRVGGAADVLFLPKDEADLAEFLSKTDSLIPVTVLGAASNVIVRDGGIAGVVVRLGPAFGKVVADGLRVTAGAAALDGRVSVAAANAGDRGAGIFLRRTGHDRRGAADECGLL
jgi:UDP-N-acetylmuramate dehydrogenase